MSVSPAPIVISDALGQVVNRLPNPRRSGDGFTDRCPSHDDRSPSLSVGPGHDRAVVLKCFRECPPEAILRALGFDDDTARAILAARRDGTVSAATGSYRPQRRGPSGVTVAELARAKGLPERELRDFGLCDAIGRRAVEIPYRNIDGGPLFTRTRTTSKTLQPAGVSLAPYGLNRLEAWRASDTRLIVEGESDCWTGWHHGRVALGVPGASSAGSVQAEHVAGVNRVYVLQEPDAGGTTFYAGVRARLTALGWDGDVYAFGLSVNGRRVKDLSDLHLAVGGDRTGFSEALDAALADAVLVDLDADQPIIWDDDADQSTWPAAARARVAELEARLSAGSDGASLCDGNCSRVVKLLEQVREYKAADELIRRGPVPTGEALALAHLVSVSANARTRGEDMVPLYVPADAKAAGVGDNTMTRALNQARRWQTDPAISATLPFRIEDEWRDGKSHLRLRNMPLPDQDGPGSVKTSMLLTVARLPRDHGRAKHGGERVACPKHPSAALTRTRIWSCTEDGCGWVKQDTARVGGTPDQDGPGSPVKMYGASFVAEVRAASPTPAQDGPHRELPYAAQDGPAPLMSVSFVSRSDAEAAAGLRLRIVPDGDAPPDDCARRGCERPADPPSWVCRAHQEDAALAAVAGGSE